MVFWSDRNQLIGHLQNLKKENKLHGQEETANHLR
jgi:hypothetical protein